jgi:hypothetical protein
MISNLLIEKMKNTYQGTQTVWEHGESVQLHLFDLLNYLR